MRKGAVLAAAVLFLTVALVGRAVGQPKTIRALPPPNVSGARFSPQQVAAGRYLVILGDCMPCHTVTGGAAFAGGRPIPTPFGPLVSANITPDRETGLGGWSSDDFYRALHEGKSRKVGNLYPAFPYIHYTKVSRADVDAIYAYLQTIPAVTSDPKRDQLPFPYRIRQLMAVWNWLFFEPGAYDPDPNRSAEWNRGAYLVQGLGHCGDCHTPRNVLGGAERRKRFRGGAFPGWFAPDLTDNRSVGLGSWSDAELLEFFRTGRNVRTAATGEMGEVVAYSTSQMTDGDLRAIITYLRSLPASPEATVSLPGREAMAAGEAIYRDQCSACHRMDGSGVRRLFPPLAGNANLQQANPRTVARLVLVGAQTMPTDPRPTAFTMPAYAWKLSDRQIADVLTYARNSWGNRAAAVSAEDVAKLRRQLKPRAAIAPVPRGSMLHPAPGTLAKPGTDSRDNGTAHAGRAAAPEADRNPRNTTGPPGNMDLPKHKPHRHEAQGPG
ncbi:MAG: cytochrome c [Novosphingobium sp.]|nr:cytochrome c [Novosphingobium sp.]